MAILGLNIDHVATLRQARYRGGDPSIPGEPDPVWAVGPAELAGARCITMHLREDRRHVNDRDVALCRQVCRVKFNLEMAPTEEMVRFAASLRPHQVTLVPEGRHEVTTEGGLNVAGQQAQLRDVVLRLHDSGCKVSAFIDADPAQVRAAQKAGFDACEIHTGPYASAWGACAGDLRDPRLVRAIAGVAGAGAEAGALGMRFNAGHALNYANVIPIASQPGIEELHIGHSVIARSVLTGLDEAVRKMVGLIERACDAGGSSPADCATP